MKVLIREEKRKQRKITVKRIKVGCKLFWSDLKGRKKNRSKIRRMKNDKGKIRKAFLMF